MYEIKANQERRCFVFLKLIQAEGEVEKRLVCKTSIKGAILKAVKTMQIGTE